MRPKPLNMAYQYTLYTIYRCIDNYRNQSIRIKAILSGKERSASLSAKKAHVVLIANNFGYIGRTIEGNH